MRPTNSQFVAAFSVDVSINRPDNGMIPYIGHKNKILQKLNIFIIVL